MCIVDSCLVIRYDGEKCSLPISEKECEAINKSLDAVFDGTARFFVGLILVVDDVTKQSYCACIIRLFGKKKSEGRDLQRKLLRSYVPPLSVNGDESKKHVSFVQRRIVNEPFFNNLNTPLFSGASNKKSTQQQELIFKKRTQ